MQQCQSKPVQMDCVQFTGKNFKKLVNLCSDCVVEKGKVFVNGKQLQVGDWLLVNSSGNSLVVSDEVFCNMWEMIS